MEARPSTLQDSVPENVEVKIPKNSKTKPKKDTTKENEKDSGIAGNKRGIDYHYHVAMCLCLEGHKHKQDNPEYQYILHQEDKEAGMFDDLVYEYRNNISEPWTRLLVQIKNKKSNNKIKTSNLLYDDKKETYSLLKFFKSSKKIKDTDNCLYILYTNASFELEDNGHLRNWYKKETKEEISLLPSQIYSIPIIDTGCLYQFNDEINVEVFNKYTNIPKEDWKRFFNKLVFAVDQPDLKEIKSVAEKKIEDILPKGTEKIWHRLYEMVNDSLLDKKQISSDEISLMIEKSKTDIQLFHVNKYEESEVEFKCNIPLHGFFLSNTCTTLPIRSNNSEFTLYKVSKIIKQLREEKPDVNQYTMKHVYSIKEVKDIQTADVLNLLIINIDNDMLLQLFKYIPKKNGQKYIIIIPNEMNLSEIPKCYQVCEDKLNSFQMLTAESKKYILENKCVLLNDKKTSFSDILKVNFNDLTQEQTEELNDVITEDVIQCFLSDDYKDLKIEFNHLGINDLSKVKYIERHLYYSVVIDENKIKEFKELHIVDNLDIFKKQCNENPYRVCHHFKKYQTFFIWDQSNGDLTYLREFINKNKASDTVSLQNLWEGESIAFAIKEDKLSSLHNMYNTILIADKPGMGKTLLMSNLYYNLQKNYPNRIIIRLNLNDHTNVFNENTNFSNLETILAFLKNILIETKSSKLSQNLLNFVLKNQHHIFLILDGVDELCPHYKNTVFNFIKILNDLKIARLFITTRPAQAVSLEEITSQFALLIKPFTKEDQLLYLNKILINKKTDTNKLIKKINENSSLKNLLGVPLLLKIVAEIINNSNDDEYNIENILNLSQLFNIFVNQKFHIYSTEKKKQVATNPTVIGDEITLQKIYSKNHEILALKLIFVEEIIQDKYDDEFTEQIIKIGIITKITDQKAEFIHRTFAEYFASTFIKAHFNEELIINILFTKVFICSDLPILRKLLNNNILLDNEETKQILSQIIKKKYLNINEIDDPLLSILFTAAYEDNLDTLNYILDNFSKYPNILEKMLSYNPNNTGLIPLQAAIRNGNIEIAKQLITICIGQIKDSHSNSLASEYLLGKGDTYGDTAIHDAAIAGYRDLVSLLLDKEADINKVNIDGETVLQKAAIGGSKDIVSLLLDKGADINKVDIYGETALHKIITNVHYGAALHMVTCEGHKDIVSLLLDKGADINKVNNNGETVLHKAAIGGSKNIVSLLLDKGADINKMSKYGETVLHKAAMGGSKDIVSLLLDKGADINQVSNDGKTALHMAAFEVHKDIVSLLLDKGADINKVDIHGETALHKIITNVHYGTALHMVTCEGHKDIVSLMLDKGVDVNTVGNGGKTALHKAACRGLKDIVNLLLDKGADINKVDEWCKSPLFEAAYEGHKDVVNLLLDKGADINNVTTGGVTVLHKAAFGGHKDVVDLLLDKGVDINKEDNSGQTALHMAAYEGNKFGVNLLHEYYKDVVRLLLDKGADINKVTNNGETALHIAAYHDHKDIVMLLLDKGANFNKVDTSGKTALHKAVCRGRKDIVNLLLDKGADINIEDNFGETALHEAVCNGNKDIVILLLDKGGDINKVKNSGETALHKAVCEGRIDLASLLLDRGADTNITSLFFGTALHVAACGGDKNIVSLLLNRGADTNIESLFFGTTLHKAAYGDIEHVVSLLLDKGADINILTLKLGTALNRAASGGQNYYFNLLLENREDIFRLRFLLEILLANYGGHRDVASLLSNEGAHINKLNLHFGTALHAAAYGGHKNVVSLLLDKGTNIDIKNNGGKTAFHMAAYEGHKDVVSLLLDKGADINIVDNSGETGLHKAGSEGHIDTLIVMLDKGADINNASLKGFTPLHWAAVCGCTESSRVLLERGADVNITNDYGERAIQLAYRTGNYKLVQLFLRHGNDLYDYSDRDSDSDSDGNSDSDSDSVLHAGLLCYVWRRNIKHRLYTTYNDLNTGDSHNRTPLYWAALLGDCDIMRVLLSKDADVNIRDINDSTILQAAFRSGNYRAVQLLLRHVLYDKISANIKFVLLNSIFLIFIYSLPIIFLIPPICYLFYYIHKAV